MYQLTWGSTSEDKFEDVSQPPKADTNDIDGGIGGQSTHSLDWDDTGADDEKRASEIEDQEKEHHSSTSEDEGERQYREAESKGVCSKVIASILTRSSMLTLCLISCPIKVMPHVTYDWSFARSLICLKARSMQAFIASSACKCTNILFYLINLYLGTLENHKRLLFSLERFRLRGLILQGQFLSFCPNSCLLYVQMDSTIKTILQDVRTMELSQKLNHLLTLNQTIGLYLCYPFFHGA